MRRWWSLACVVGCVLAAVVMIGVADGVREAHALAPQPTPSPTSTAEFSLDHWKYTKPAESWDNLLLYWVIDWRVTSGDPVQAHCGGTIFRSDFQHNYNTTLSIVHDPTSGNAMAGQIARGVLMSGDTSLLFTYGFDADVWAGSSAAKISEDLTTAWSTGDADYVSRTDVTYSVNEGVYTFTTPLRYRHNDAYLSHPIHHSISWAVKYWETPTRYLLHALFGDEKTLEDYEEGYISKFSATLNQNFPPGTTRLEVYLAWNNTSGSWNRIDNTTVWIDL